MNSIRSAALEDHDAVWSIFQRVIAAGDAFVFDSGTTREQALAYWFAPSHHVYVAEVEERVMGAYFIHPNQPGRGAHIANASYMVAPEGRGLGLGKMMGEHSLIEAKRLGFSAMQFNIVVATNESAVRLWKSLGFQIVGTLPGAFRHAIRGDVDAYIMFRLL